MITSRRRHQRARGRVPQPVDLVVDRRVLFDVGVGGREVGLGLVVVVVRDEVLDPVLREQLPELAGELGRQALVGREHDGGTVDLGDHRGGRERLARAGDAEERLEAVAPLDPRDERLDRRGLVARRRQIGHELERRHARMVTARCDIIPGRLNASPHVSTWAGERVEVAVVGDDVRGDGAALLVGGLRGHAPLRVFACHTACHQAIEPHVPRRLDHHHRVVLAHPLIPRLDQQLDLHDHDGVGRCRRDPAVHLRHDRGVGDGLERPPALVVGEREVGQRGPVQRAVVPDDPEPNRSASAPSAGWPGSTTQRATASASTTWAPRCPNSSATVDLPDADSARQGHKQHRGILTVPQISHASCSTRPLGASIGPPVSNKLATNDPRGVGNERRGKHESVRLEDVAPGQVLQR